MFQGSVEAVPDHPLDAITSSTGPPGTARQGVVDGIDSDLLKPRTFVTQGGGGGNEKYLMTQYYRSYGAAPHVTKHSRGSEASNGGGIDSIPTSPAISAVQHEPMPR